MNLVVDFYKELDTLNLIIFWGIIIVIVLLLIFSIIIVNKNKKLKQIIESKNKLENNSEEIPIIKIENETVLPEETKKEDKIEQISAVNIEQKKYQEEIPKTIEEEKTFVAEEHVIGYNQDLFSLSNIKKTSEVKEEKPIYDEPKNKEEIKLPNAPYQRNVLREMSLNQTSPIGIVKPVEKQNVDLKKAEELQKDLTEAKIIENTYEELPIINKEPTPKKIDNKIEDPEINERIETISKEYAQKHEEPIKKNIEYQTLKNESITKENTSKEKYLEEVSKKLAEAELTDDIDRTEYELKQEEEAIISYEELMQKKDTLKMIDEEEAVISIEELIRKQEQKEKLYNITEEEENDKFINELKNFRSDL